MEFRIHKNTPQLEANKMIVKVNDKTNDFWYLIYDEIKNSLFRSQKSVSVVCVNKTSR